MKKTLIDVYCLDEKTKEDLSLEDEKEYLLFEWDPDYMVLQEDWEVLEHVYFTDYEDKIIIDWASGYEDKLIEFYEDDEHWKPFEKQTREAFQAYDWLKIAYRGWVGYVYSLYYYDFEN